MRFLAFVLSLALTAVFVVAALVLGGIGWIIGAVLVGAVAALGIFDLIQRRHSILRNYPILGVRDRQADRDAREPRWLVAQSWSAAARGAASA